MTSNSISTLQSVLSRFDAFSDLDEETLHWLSSNSQPYHCSVGQSILLTDRLPEFCYCIVEGRGRVLHHDPGLRRPVTLAYSQPGDLIGWAGLVRRSPCEWITAATPLKLIDFSAEIFYALEERSSSFRDWLDSGSPAEIMLFLNILCTRPTAEPQEREVMRKLVSEIKMLPLRQQRTFQRIQMISICGTLKFDFTLPVGREVDVDILKSILVPLRLFSCSRRLV